MKETHSLFILFLLFLTLSALTVLSMKGIGYYTKPLDQRPYHEDHKTMKPSGNYSHGLGMFGALLIVVGVSVYSTRKRVKALWKTGKLSRWLEFHIVLCLLGPIFVIYHTTFKAGGIAAISLWTMISVAASGVIGRFLYVLIPRNLNGNELTLEELDKKIVDVTSNLNASPVGKKISEMLDNSFAETQKPENFSQAVSVFWKLQKVKLQTAKETKKFIRQYALPAEQGKSMYNISQTRATLVQRSLLLQQVERLFYYWHVIHLPFSIIMFVTLAAHVAVSLWLGYTWIF